MNIIQLMEQNKSQFTPNDLLIYQKISENPGITVQMTTSTLAETCGVSQPALTRFIKSLGYHRYQDFRADLIAWVAEQRAKEKADDRQLEYFSITYQLLQETEKILTDEYMHNLAAYVNNFDRVYATGLSKSFHPASLLEILMFKTGRYFHAISSDNLGELSDSMTDKDLLIIFSVSAKPSLMQPLAGTLGKIMLVTANPTHTFKNVLDQQVLLPYIQPSPEESAISPVLFDMFVEILCRYLVMDYPG